MFTGIVKGICHIIKVTEQAKEGNQTGLKIKVKRPADPAFSGLKPGDSVAVDGVCLTLEQVSLEEMSFHLSFETLKITGWNKQKLVGKKVNMEPALRVGDFVGGHFMSGHVDGMAKVVNLNLKGESLLMEVKIPIEFKNRFWKKAFISLNGVSLTINEVQKDRLFLCLIPETLNRSNLNLSDQRPGSLLTFEVDYLSHFLPLIK